MEGDGISLVIALLFLVVMSAYFSATETAFTGLNKIRLKNMVKEGNTKAQTVLDLAEDYDKLLSTILIGNNVVNISNASIATVLFTMWLGDSGVTVSTIVMTVIILIFGEVSPKSVAKQYPEKIAMLSAPLLKIFIFIFTPFNFLLSLWRNFFNKLFKDVDGPTITEEELKTIVTEVENEGVIEKHEGELIRSAIEFDDLTAEDIYIPRTEMVAINENDSLEKINEIFLKHGFSRLPVYRDSIDHIIGVILQKDFYRLMNKQLTDIKDIIKDVVYVMDNKKLSLLLKELQQAKSHMAIVVDEYGGTEGLVTLEDIIEELVGDIWDEHDEILDFFKEVSENTYLISCNADFEDMIEHLELDIEADHNIATVNGWVIKKFDKIPSVGDSIDVKNIRVTVTAAESKKVNEICIEKL